MIRQLGRRRGPWAVLGMGMLSLLIFTCHSPTPSMTVLVRCEPGLTGELEIEVVSPSGVVTSRDVFRLEQVCADGQVGVSSYQVESSLEYRLTLADGRSSSLSASYETEVQSSPGAYFTVVAIRNSEPHLAPDRL